MEPHSNHHHAPLKKNGKDSGANTPENNSEDEGQPSQVATGGVNATILGCEDCPVDPNAEEIEYSMIFKITKIAGLDECKNLKRLGLRKNLIKKIEGLENNLELTELELYDNRISTIENVSHLSNMRILDLAFNKIRKIEGLEGLVNLKKLFLNTNKISKIENLSSLTNLEMLELGDNKIKVIENLENLTNLQELYLSKNLITKIQNINHLTGLYLLALQANFIEKLENIENLVNLDQLHISGNKITKIENLENLTNLTILDLSSNRVGAIENLENQKALEDLWLSGNKIQELNEPLLGSLSIKVLYLAGNPIAQREDYSTTVLNVCKNLVQLDHNNLTMKYNAKFTKPDVQSSLKDAENSSKAKAILEEVLKK